MSDIKRRPKFEVVLSALRQGEGERTVRLPVGVKVGWYEGKLCCVLDVWLDGSSLDRSPDHERWVPCDLPINFFIEQCNGISDDDITMLVCSTVLSQR